MFSDFSRVSGNEASKPPRRFCATAISWQPSVNWSWTATVWSYKHRMLVQCFWPRLHGARYWDALSRPKMACCKCDRMISHRQRPIKKLWLTLSFKRMFANRSKVVIFGIIGAALTAIILRKIYLRKKQERIERKLKETLENARRERKQLSRTRPLELREDQKCIVCIDNPKEIICLPCGHVCLCEDCSSKVQLTCPVCRARIENKSVAFIS